MTTGPHRMTGPRILIVDDDPHIRDVVRIAAEGESMSTLEAANGKIALTTLQQKDVDLVVLDVGMPEMDGYAFCRAVRQKSNLPILFLTARNDEIDRILGFELGGDDFLAKPFSPRELMLRIKAVLARGRPTVQKNYRQGALFLEPEGHRVLLDDQAIDLTATEFSLLHSLLRQPTQVFSRNQLIASVYGGNSQLSGRTLDSHIRNIRAKAADQGCEDIIETVHGVGIRLGACTS